MLKTLHNRFEIVRTLGTGGAGQVYEAEDLRLGRRVAIKRVRIGETGHRQARAVFLLREAQSLARIQHPNVAVVHDILEGETSVSIVMELVRGPSLRALIEKRAIPELQFVGWFSQLLAGLEAVHQEEIVHRDVNPRNVLVSDKGLLKLIDFGLASKAGDPNPRAGGTVGYMPPEALRTVGRPAFTLDVYGAGFTAYQALLGLPRFKRLYGTSSPREWARWLLSRESFKTLREIDESFSAALSAVIARMTAKDPAARYQTIASIWKDYRRIAGRRSESESDDDSADGAARAAALEGEGGA